MLLVLLVMLVAFKHRQPDFLGAELFRIQYSARRTATMSPSSKYLTPLLN
jgi:hypothetical protein